MSKKHYYDLDREREKDCIFDVLSGLFIFVTIIFGLIRKLGNLKDEGEDFFDRF